MRFLTCQLVAPLLAVSMQAMAASDVAPANRLCASDQLELFSCTLESNQSVGICLDKPTLRMTFVRQIKPHSMSSAPLSNVREATVGENAHGNQIVVTAVEPRRLIALFVDGDHYDMEPPILVARTGSRSRTELCRRNTELWNPAVLRVNGKDEPVNLFSLEMFGVAAKLDDPPAWPKLKGRSFP